jgi:broad specificity phosphatase PhoE
MRRCPDGWLVLSRLACLQTAGPLGRTPWAWRALDEIDGGICDSLSHAQIQERLPEEYAARKRNKFNMTIRVSE